MGPTAMLKLCTTQTKNAQRAQYFIKTLITALEKPKLLSHTSYSPALSM